jgi:chromosome segregation ATPase
VDDFNRAVEQWTADKEAINGFVADHNSKVMVLHDALTANQKDIDANEKLRHELEKRLAELNRQIGDHEGVERAWKLKEDSVGGKLDDVNVKLNSHVDDWPDLKKRLDAFNQAAAAVPAGVIPGTGDAGLPKKGPRIIFDDNAPRRK